MPHYRYAVSGGEFTIQGNDQWRITFNGVQLGGLYDSASDALNAIEARRTGVVPGANLIGVADPPTDLHAWQHTV